VDLADIRLDRHHLGVGMGGKCRDPSACLGEPVAAEIGEYDAHAALGEVLGCGKPDAGGSARDDGYLAAGDCWMLHVDIPSPLPRRPEIWTRFPPGSNQQSAVRLFADRPWRMVPSPCATR